MRMEGGCFSCLQPRLVKSELSAAKLAFQSLFLPIAKHFCVGLRHFGSCCFLALFHPCNLAGE